MSKPDLTIKVCYFKGVNPFICEVYGKISVMSLIDMEDELKADSEENQHELIDKEGEYEFGMRHYKAQVGEFGRVEVPAHWDFDLLSYKPFDKDTSYDTF